MPKSNGSKHSLRKERLWLMAISSLFLAHPTWATEHLRANCSQFFSSLERRSFLNLMVGTIAAIHQSSRFTDSAFKALTKASGPEKRLSFWKKILKERFRLVDELESTGRLDQIMPGLGNLDSTVRKKLKRQLVRNWLLEDIKGDFSRTDLASHHLRNLFEVSRRIKIYSFPESKLATLAGKAREPKTSEKQLIENAKEVRPTVYVLPEFQNTFYSEFLEQRPLPALRATDEEIAIRQRELDQVFGVTAPLEGARTFQPKAPEEATRRDLFRSFFHR